MITAPHSKAYTCIDLLIEKIPSQADALLDIRLALMGQGEPGQCVTSYFKLRKALSAWHQSSLEELRSLLETKIQIEIVIEESNQRQRTCLALGNNHDIADFCQEQMKQAALEHKKSSKIYMGFCWAEAA